PPHGGLDVHAAERSADPGPLRSAADQRGERRLWQLNRRGGSRPAWSHRPRCLRGSRPSRRCTGRCGGSCGGTGRSPSRRSLLLLYHLVTVHAVSHAPFYAWMLLASAWARRAPLLWAFLPPLALGYLEKTALSSTRFFALLLDRLAGGTAAMPMAGTFVT